jgi:hypothetical protein
MITGTDWLDVSTLRVHHGMIHTLHYADEIVILTRLKVLTFL